MACILENYNTCDAVCYPLFGGDRFAKLGKFTCCGRVSKCLDCFVVLRNQQKNVLDMKTTLFQWRHLVMAGFLYEAKEDSDLSFSSNFVLFAICVFNIEFIPQVTKVQQITHISSLLCMPLLVIGSI